MRRAFLAIVALFALPLYAQTAEEIVAKYIKTIGGMDKIEAVKSIRRTGKFTGGGGFEAGILEEKKRPNLIRQEFTIQGMVGVTAYDGKNGWKIEPWEGKKDPEALGEEEMKSIVEDSDFEGPLVNYGQKGNKVEYVGMEPVEGTDAYKLKLTLKSGDILYYYMDTDYFVPIKIDTKRFVRGEEREYETSLGDYKEVAGWYLPYAMETNRKGSPFKQKITVEKVEVNIPLDEGRFREPEAKKPPEVKKPPAASNQTPDAHVILTLSVAKGKDLKLRPSPMRSFAVSAAQDDVRGQR